MTYGLNPGLFVEDGPAIHAANTVAARPRTRFLQWRRLDSERRLAVIERALERPRTT